MRTDDYRVLCSRGSWPGSEGVHAGTKKMEEVSEGLRREGRKAELTRKETWQTNRDERGEKVS